MALTGPMKDFWSFWREIQKKTMRPADLALVAAPGALRDQWQQELRNGSSYPERLSVIDIDRPEPVHTDVALVVLDGPGALRAGSFRALAGFDRKRMAALVIEPTATRHRGDDRAARRIDDPLFRRHVATALEIPPDQLLGAASPLEGASELCAHPTEQLHEYLIPLARQFPLFRTAVATDEIHATAKQNALVGLLPLPGSDMPIMTANQIKMVLRLAAMHDLALTGDRAKELMGVVVGGFGLRTAARQLIKLLPGPGWAIAGGIGYTGTVAMGKAALEYFKRTASPRIETGVPSAGQADTVES